MKICSGAKQLCNLLVLTFHCKNKPFHCNIKRCHFVIVYFEIELVSALLARADELVPTEVCSVERDVDRVETEEVVAKPAISFVVE